MRIRKKHWARPALEVCDFFVVNPKESIGKWHGIFETPQKIWLELGCGKGGFISKLGSSRPDINFIAIDIKDEVLVLAKEKIEKEYEQKKLSTGNIRLMAHEIMQIHTMLNQEDRVDRIYVNFCNPWFKNRNKGRRLTHPNQLNQYKNFLAPEGQIWFKTDDTPLFLESIQYFEQSGFQIITRIEDLHRSGFLENIETEHEKMFSNEGIPIKFLIAGRK
jgi:tRNA (guanine-N7-)-methyltransferase